MLIQSVFVLSCFLARSDLTTDPADAIRSRLAAVGDGSRYDADEVIVLDETDVTVRPDGVGVSTHRRVARILRDGAVRSEAVQRFGFDPTTNQIELKAVRVHRADGQIEDVPLDSAVVQPAPQWGIYWGSQQMLVSVPRLDIGDAVETSMVKTGFNVAYLGEPGAASAGADVATLRPPMPGHWYDEVSFASGVPVIEKRYTVRMPRDKLLQYEIYNGQLRSSVLFDGDQTVYRFELRDIAPFKGEPGMVSGSDVQCKLVLATLPDWKSKSRWFHEKNEGSFVTDDGIKEKVREVTRACKNDEEKITALNHWVAENIRYVGTSRGVCEGYTTHPVRETFRDRGGVCKDKAGLLVAMLREAGFDSYIVMTEAGSDVMPVPADQFNHAVTCIRQKDGTFRLLDPTWMPKSRENWSSAEQLQHVVYGTPEGEMLTRSPYSGPENNAITWRGQSRVEEDGGLTGKLDLTATGVPETNLRRALAGRRPAERIDLVETSFARFAPAAMLGHTTIMNPVDFSGPIAVQCDYEIDGFALGSGERRWIVLPIMQTVLGDVMMSDVAGCASLDSRKYPVRLRSTRRVQVSESIQLPSGWSAANLPDSQSLDGPAASLKFSIEKSANRIEYRCDVDIKKHQVPPAEYANLKKVLDTLSELGKRMIACQREASHAGL